MKQQQQQQTVNGFWPQCNSILFYITNENFLSECRYIFRV